MPLAPEQTILNGKYRLIRLIGEGGMARVWLAEEVTFGSRRVALKEPRAGLEPADRDLVRRRFDREVRVCAALEKARVPNIVHALTAEPTPDGKLLVLEYMPGGDLAELLKQHPSGLPVERAMEIAIDLLRALAGVYGHALEVVHRDVKPSNVLFDEQGRAFLGDFGLAQAAGASGDLTKLLGGSAVGTPLYAAPEQETGKGYLTPAADLYALGCVVWEMLTGKRYKRYKPGTPPSALRREVPGWLDEAVLRALAEDPWERWQAAGEMAAALAEGGRQRAGQETGPEQGIGPREPRKDLGPWKPRKGAEGAEGGGLRGRQRAGQETGPEQGIGTREPRKGIGPREPRKGAEDAEGGGLRGRQRAGQETGPEQAGAEGDGLRAGQETGPEQGQAGIGPREPRKGAEDAEGGGLRGGQRAGQETGPEQGGAGEPLGQMDAAQRRRQEAEERARQEARRLVAARAEKVRQEEAERAERARLEESAPRVLVLKETAEGALAGWRLEEARQAAEAWLGLEPEAERPVEVLARVAYLEELGLGGLRRTPSGLVIAGPETLAELLGMPEPPPRVWWERAEIELCLVPAGAFPMGSAEGDKAAASDEKPQHEVGLDAFYLCRTPVTQAQYARFVQGTGHRVPSMEVGWEKPYNWDPKRKAPPEGRSHQPVVLVSWGDAAAYCAWAGLRLPTEAEWEKAVSWDAVGGRKRAYPWGDEWDSRRCNSAERIAGRPLPTYDEWKKWWDGWQKLDVAKRSQDTTTPVGAFSPGGDSPCGCADMAGNVWEWCADWYGATYYPRSAAHNPRGPETGEYRVLRGGSWANLSYDVRSANRIGNLPDYRSYYIGFRCVSSSTSSP